MPLGSPLCLSFEISPPNGFACSCRRRRFSERRCLRPRRDRQRVRESRDCWVRLCRGPNALETPAVSSAFRSIRVPSPNRRALLIDARFHFGEKIFEAGGAFEIESHLTLADAGKVLVRVSEARQDSVAFEIDDTRVCAHVFLRAAFVPTKTIRLL